MSDSNIVEFADDRDVRVEYSGEWQEGGVIEEYDGTTHGTYVKGAQAKFTFQGSSIAVYGTLSDNRGGIPLNAAPISTYVLDGSPPKPFSPTFQNGVFYRQLFYQSSGLDDKQHTLIITSTVSDAAFWLDYFQITPSIASSSSPPPPPPPPSTTHTTSTILDSTTGLVTQLSLSPTASTRPTTIVSASSTDNVRVSQTPSVISQVVGTPSSTQNGESLIAGDASPTEVNSSVPSTTNTVPVGAIAGGVIGGVILILLACLLLLLYRRRMRSRKAPSEFGIQPQDSDTVNPFLTPHPFVQETRENENTRFLGAVSPFTSHQSSQSTSTASGGVRVKAAINFTSGPQAMEKPSHFGHPTNPLPRESTEISEEGPENSFNRGASPRGEGSTSNYVTDLVAVDTPPAYEPRR